MTEHPFTAAPNDEPRPAPASPAPAAIRQGEADVDLDEGVDPVPITVWHVPAPPPGAVMSGQLTRRLIVNYSPPGGAVLDLSDRGHTADSDTEATVALVVTSWPRSDGPASRHLAEGFRRLRPGGCLAVIVANTQIPDHLGLLVSAARTAGLTYLQHVVAAHHLAPRAPSSGAGRRDRNRFAHGERHLRVHTDVLVFMRPRAADD